VVALRPPSPAASVDASPDASLAEGLQWLASRAPPQPPFQTLTLRQLVSGALEERQGVQLDPRRGGGGAGPQVGPFRSDCKHLQVIEVFFQQKVCHMVTNKCECFNCILRIYDR
jgi:hypothetical protein